MISVIVCSRSAHLFETLSKNIEATIGVPYEIIKIDNSNNAYSLCKAYNEGAERSHYPYLCFIHEDILFKTVNWGGRLIDHFSQTGAGIVGVAGAIYKSKMPCGWWQSEDDSAEIRRMNILHTAIDETASHLFINPFNEVRSGVVLIDGVFIGTTKEVWQKHKFDEALFKGFHGYDLDFSFSVAQTKKIFVVYDILLEHFSIGTRDLQWMSEMIKLHKKWETKLPFKSAGYQITPRLAYEYSWRRLRKNMVALMNCKSNRFFLIKSYHCFFSLLDCKPNVVSLYKDYLIELIKTGRSLYKINSARKNIHGGRWSLKSKSV